MNFKTDLTDPLFKKISKYVYDTCGINLTDAKRELVNTRVGKIIASRRLSGFREYYEYLINDESGYAVEELMNAISTNLTAFFREASHFDFLAKNIVPELQKTITTTKGYKFRAWSAGSSTGAEIYTIAMVLLEAFPEIMAYDSKLLATDIDTNVLNVAEKAVYNKNMIENVPNYLKHRYFIRSLDKNRYRAKKVLRDFITFKYLNLIEKFPFKYKMDFIFCRNVMIYFDSDTQQKLIQKFYDALRPGGYLFIGHSESLSRIEHKFTYEKPTIYYKK